MHNLPDTSHQKLSTLPGAQVSMRKKIPRPFTPRKVVYVIGRSTLSSEGLIRRVRWSLAALVLLALLAGIGVRVGGQLVVSALPSLASLRTAPAEQTATALAAGGLTITGGLPTVTPISTATPEPILRVAVGQSRVQAEDVYLRQLPGPDAPKITVLRRGTPVEILGEAQRVGDTIWIHVREQSNQGWVNQRYVIPAEEYSADARPRARVVGVIPDRLLVRASPSLSADVRGRISEGAEVALMEMKEAEGTTWWLVEIDSLQGWARADYLEQLP